jgi:PadR family transcriptional regulator, regulatory protein PadR
VVDPGSARLAQRGALLRLRANGANRGGLEEEFGFEQINPGSVYRTLRRMENEGLCSSEWDVRAEEGSSPRRMYAITDAGEAYLEAWAAACEKYHRLINQFSRVYGRRTPRSSE